MKSNGCRSELEATWLSPLFLKWHAIMNIKWYIWFHQDNLLSCIAQWGNCLRLHLKYRGQSSLKRSVPTNMRITHCPFVQVVKTVSLHYMWMLLHSTTYGTKCVVHLQFCLKVSDKTLGKDCSLAVALLQNEHKNDTVSSHAVYVKLDSERGLFHVQFKKC